jgi:hypothetical protein
LALKLPPFSAGLGGRHTFQQAYQSAIEGLSQTGRFDESDIPFSSFDSAYVVAMALGTLRQFLLRESKLNPSAAYINPKQLCFKRLHTPTVS